MSQPGDKRRWESEEHRCECTRRATGRQGILLRSLLATLIALTCLSSAAEAAFEGARYRRDAERHFTRGITAYGRDDLDVARASFRAVADMPANQRSGAALLMLSRTLIRLGDGFGSGPEAAAAYSAAVSASRELMKRAPNSRYTADARLLTGDAYHQLKRFYEAATEYARILDSTAPLAVQASAAERLAGIVRNRAITKGALDHFRLQLGDARLADALLFGDARWYERLGWTQQSRERFATYADSVGSAGMFHNLARAASRQHPTEPPAFIEPEPETPSTADSKPMTALDLAGGRENVPRIGILAPMSGPRWERELGRDLLAGAQMANEEMGEPFDFVVVDTGSEYIDFGGESVPIYQSEASRMVRAVAGTRRLVDEVGVVAIIGPAFSTSCAAAAGVAEAAGVSLIAPLAQQSGLDTLGSHLFQLNPIPEVQGRALAEYATLVLGLETLAILSTLSDYGYAFAQAFTHTATRNGGRVVHSDWYYPEATDFRAQFDSLKQKGFRLMPSAGGDSLALFDSLETALLDTSVAGEWMFEELVRAAGLDNASSLPDSSEMFVDTIDGIVIVAEDFDAAARVAPQLHFHRLQTHMLGNDIWNDPEALANLPRTELNYLLGATFVSRREGSTAEQDFIDRYRLRTRRDDAAGYAASGFDAASLIVQGWLSGHRTRADLRQFLADLRQYEGASGRISFTETRRANVEMALLTIDDNGLIRSLGTDDLPILEPSYVDADLPAENLLEEGGDPTPWQPGDRSP